MTLASLGLGAVTEPAVGALVDPILLKLGVAPPPAGHHTTIAIFVALGISSALHIVIGEQAPKNWAIRFADTALPILSVPLVCFTYVFYPFIWALNAVTNSVLRLTGVGTHDDGGEHGELPHTEDDSQPGRGDYSPLWFPAG